MLRLAWRMFIRDEKMRKNSVFIMFEFFLIIFSGFLNTYLVRAYGGDNRYEVSVVLYAFSMFTKLCYPCVYALCFSALMTEMSYSRQEVTLLLALGYGRRKAHFFESFKHGIQLMVSFCAALLLFFVLSGSAVLAVPSLRAGYGTSYLSASAVLLAATQLTNVTAGLFWIKHAVAADIRC